MSTTPIRILGGVVDHGALSKPSLIGFPSSVSETAAEVALNTILFDDNTGDLRSYKTADANSANSNAKYLVQKIVYTNDPTKAKPIQHLTAAETLTQTWSVWVYPIGGLWLAIEEDGDTTPITDANSGTGSAGITYADLVVGTADTQGMGSDALTGDVYAPIQIDSTTVNATQGNLLLQLDGLAVMKAYNSTSGSKRIFRCRVYDDKDQEHQVAGV